jgi:hypothetical protein
MQSEYHFWETALADPAAIGKTVKTDENNPQPGFYRTKQGQPVAIWRDHDGFLVVMRGDDIVPERDQADIWLRCLNRPVTEDQYHGKRDNGRWHDEVEAVTETLGGNIANAEDPETLAELINSLVRAANETDVDSDDAANQAQSIRSRLNELSGRADKIREKLKAPHLEAGRKIDKAWNPMIKLADKAAQDLRALISRWETKKRDDERRAEQERQRLAELERQGKQPPLEATTAPPLQVTPAPKPRVAGAYGRAAALRVRNVVTALDDQTTVYNRYCGHPDVIALLTRLAQRDVDAGLQVPGVIIEEQVDVR